MKVKSNKTLIISLIAEDMVNYKLLSALSQTGIQADFFFLKVTEIVFDMMGFKNDKDGEEAYDYYMSRLHETKRLRVDLDRSAIKPLALEIYAELERRLSNGK